MKVTTKGQITVPRALREQFGLQPGTEVEFVVEEHALLLRPRKPSKGPATVYDAWITKAVGSGHTKLTTDQIMANTRGVD